MQRPKRSQRSSLRIRSAKLWMGQHKHVFKLNDPRFFWKRGVEVIDVLMMFDDVCWDVFLFDDFLHVFEGTVFFGFEKKHECNHDEHSQDELCETSS